jgi:hypothetical protein
MVNSESYMGKGWWNCISAYAGYHWLYLDYAVESGINHLRI